MADREKRGSSGGDDKEKTGALPVPPKNPPPSSNPDYQSFPPGPGAKPAPGPAKDGKS